MKTSNEGKKALIEREGGIKLKAYRDAGGYSIAVGNQTYLNNTKVQRGDTITLSEALSLFSLKLPYYESAVNKLVRVPLTQNQFDSLVSLVWNIGPGNFAKSKLLKYINSKQPPGLILKTYKDTVLTSQGVPSAALKRRRATEAEQFVSNLSHSIKKETENKIPIILVIAGIAVILYSF
jgi:lysozyme